MPVLLALVANAVSAQHWSLVPLERPDLPAADAEAPRLEAIDRFLCARQAQEGVRPSPEADPVTLVRRVYLDLTGLPPSPEDVDAYLADPTPDRYSSLVERALASPHHAERMAVWWLDLVRYADTVGYHGDQEHSISPYRDYVLKAFRDNYSFDRFTREQLAGDLLPERTTEQWIASAYNRLLQTTHEGGAQPGEYLAKYAADRVRNVSQVWMGVTLGCAECHDHKYDPYSQRDFYRMAAFFADIDEEKGFGAPNTSPTKRPPEVEVVGPLEDQTTARLVMVTVAKEPRITRVLRRGDWMDDGGEIVEPGVPNCLPPLALGDRRATRLDLAEWMTSPRQPQTARVIVNRIWALFFGRGISLSLDDSGVRAALPAHPALLDWLAAEFVAGGWDMRALIRAIVTSAAYRQSSRPRPELAGRDPNGDWFARQSTWRLPAEFVRDTALSVSGLLVDRLGGPSVHPYQPPRYYAHLNFPEREYQVDTDERQYRRGVYVHWQRMFLHPTLKAFDAPTREECTAQRAQSNTPLQALALLDDPTFVEAAREFAVRILREDAATDSERIALAWRRALARSPDARETGVLAQLLASQRASYLREPAAAAALLSVGLTPAPDDLDPVEVAAWVAVARAILNLHETITRS